jgi:hypothetical protein
VLAISLGSPDDWLRIRDAFQVIRTLELQAGRQRSEDPQSRPHLGDFGRRRAEAGLETVRRAIVVLEPLAQGRATEEALEHE